VARAHEAPTEKETRMNANHPKDSCTEPDEYEAREETRRRRWPHNDRHAERVMEALYILLEACDGFVDAHEGHACGEDCPSHEQAYDEVFVLRHVANVAESLIGGEMWGGFGDELRERVLAQHAAGEEARRSWWRRECRETAAAAARARPESALSVRRLARGVGRLVAAELRGALERLENAAK
jgi:hypothetical protein